MPLFPSQQRTHVLSRGSGHENVPAPGATASSLLRRYRPLETRATGGFGSVEICLDSRLQRRVAIKRIPLASPDVRTTAETVSQALAEARTASLLQHPNIVSVIDFTYDAAYAYLVMEYVDGMSLEEFLSGVEGHSLTYDEAANIADALVQALTFAHENGVLHLDIKPANVLIDRNGHVKITDFGMATLASAAGFGGARGGTIGYMPPEQLMGQTVDERTDIFALACVMYEALCGTAPFRAATPADSEARIEKGVILPSDLLPDIPPTTEEALISALSIAPEARPGTMGAFGDLLLDGLGNAREGRKSFARMIAHLTSDEEVDDEEPAHGGAARTWELDPAEGYLGSRTPHARRALAGAVCGVSVTAASWVLLGPLGLESTVERIAAALAIGTAAGIAPQIGSALILTGFLVAILNATPIIAVLPVAAITCALACSWWLVWGRVDIGASAALAVACAGMTFFDPVLAAPFAIVAGGCLTRGPGSASSVALGAVLGALVGAARQTGGALDVAAAATALAQLPLLASVALAAGGAAALAFLLEFAWMRYLDGRGAGTYVLAFAAPLLAEIVLTCLAHPMEITSLSPLHWATVFGAGAVSSIIVWIYVYLFGYRKERPERDCS